MKRGKASKTADAVAAIRARHLLRDYPLVFSDPLALSLTSAVWRTICRNRLLCWLVIDKILGPLRPVQASVLARARYVEETLDVALAHQATDYVILGAGLDSYSLRQSETRHAPRVWEIDHPDSQERKLTRLRNLGVVLPGNVTFIAADLARESLAMALSAHGFDTHSTAFVSLLGVSYYLPEEDLLALVETIAGYFSAGSELVMDIRVARHLIDPTYLPVFEKTERFTARRGEAMISAFDPADFIEKARSRGLACIDALSPDVLRDRYFSNRSDGLMPSPEIYLLHFRVG